MEADILNKSISKNKDDRCVRQLCSFSASIDAVLETNRLNESLMNFLETLGTLCYMLLIY